MLTKIFIIAVALSGSTVFAEDADLNGLRISEENNGTVIVETFQGRTRRFARTLPPIEIKKPDRGLLAPSRILSPAMIEKHLATLDDLDIRNIAFKFDEAKPVNGSWEIPFIASVRWDTGWGPNGTFNTRGWLRLGKSSASKYEGFDDNQTAEALFRIVYDKLNTDDEVMEFLEEAAGPILAKTAAPVVLKILEAREQPRQIAP